jgi:hypothetical protein
MGWATRENVSGQVLLAGPADAGRIFQPFQRPSDRTSHDGFGLDLAIVASITAIHGGTAKNSAFTASQPASAIVPGWAGTPSCWCSLRCWSYAATPSAIG